jgi:hypothetical protein
MKICHDVTYSSLTLQWPVACARREGKMRAVGEGTAISFDVGSRKRNCGKVAKPAPEYTNR